MADRPPPQLAALDWRVVEVPGLGPVAPERAAAAARGRMLPPLAVAHARGAEAVCCWVRGKPGGRVAVLVGGSITADVRAGAGGTARLTFPAGAVGRPMPPGQGLATLSRLACWQQAELSMEPLAVEGEGIPGPQLEDLFALLPGQPMAVAVVAVPVARDGAQPRLDELSDQVDALQAHAEGRGSERLKLERAQAELRYLETWSALGFWDLQVWTGATTPGECRAAAGLVGSSSDLGGLPLRVRPRPLGRAATGPTAPTSATGASWSEHLIVGADALGALMRSPNRELPGIRVADALEFDLTPEVDGPFRVGDVVDSTRSPCVAFSLPSESINRHVFVTGATGSGKSESVRALLEQLSLAGVPWLVIEPAKSEYGSMAGRLRSAHQEVVVVRPGVADVAPASLNPLEPTSLLLDNPSRRVYFPLQTHVDLVRALFTAAFDANEPFPQILARALAMSYEELGWNLALGRATEGDPAIRPRFPVLADLQRCALAAVDAVGYGREVRDNVRGFVDVRIGSLRLGTPGRFFQGGHPLDLERMLKANVVFEIEDLGDDNDKAFFIGTVIIRVFELLRLCQAHGLLPPGLHHVSVIEEAHRLLRNVAEDSPAAHAVTMFANLLAEVRAYGEGIIVAEQIPAKVIPDVVKNSAVKLLHRLPAGDDRAFVGSTMNLSDVQSQAVVALTPGLVVAHVDGMDRPVLVNIDASGRVRDARDPASKLPPLLVRSTACPPRCKGEPCTLEGLVESAALALQPRFVLWAEIGTLAHLTGDPLGALSDSLAQRLAAEHPERVRCAIGLAVSAAVDRRSRWIRLFYDPRRLARAVADALARQLVDRTPCGRPDPSWQIARFRWSDVRRALDDEDQATRDAPAAHAVPSSWAQRGLRLQGRTWAEQRASLAAIEKELETPFSPTYLGQPVAIDPAAAALSRRPNRAARLDEALAGVLVLPSRWPSFRLYPARESAGA